MNKESELQPYNIEGGEKLMINPPKPNQVAPADMDSQGREGGKKKGFFSNAWSGIKNGTQKAASVFFLFLT